MQRSTLITRKAPLAGAMGLLVWAVACGGTDNPETAARWESGSVGPLAAEIPAGEFRNRRERLLAALPDGITLLHARPAPKTETEWGFVQDPSFYYFTGIGDLTGAVVALDGPASQVVLFLPPAPESFGFPVPGLVPPANDDTARELGMDAVHPWDHLAVWVDDRLAAGVAAIYVDEARRPEPPGVPSSFSATSGALSLWASALEERFPSATFRSAKEAIHDLRWRKSPAEAAILRANAANTAVALAEVARAVQPGMRQRQAEAVVVASCIEGGGEGPSFWPWVMSGPNAQLDGLVQAFFRYSQLDRVMREGEVIRVDIGCAGQGYGADVGRTLPVSGTFTEGQAEAWNLVVAGYEAGLAAMSHGVPIRTVREASTAAVQAGVPALRTNQGRLAARTILDGGDGIWHIHGIGIESGEDAATVLEEGAVVAYEPMVAAGEDTFYLEDMILITSDGAEVLSDGLPRSAAGLEAMMRGESGPVRPDRR